MQTQLNNYDFRLINMSLNITTQLKVNLNPKYLDPIQFLESIPMEHQ